MQFTKYHGNPVIPRTPGTFFSRYSANPDLLFYNGKYHFYFRGQGAERHDQIGAAFSAPGDFDGIHWEYYEGNPIIPVGGENDFDGRHVLDPAAAVFSGKVFLYYSGHPLHGKASIGLAVSDDGISFTKADSNPVISRAIAPETVIHNGILYLFYQRDDAGFFEVYCCTSKDGYSFNLDREKKVFPPSSGDDFDSFSISTVRIWKDEDFFYMIYGGCDTFKDYPKAFGLAKSSDLINWKRYPGNPVMTRGEEGDWDEGAVWFPTVHKADDTYYLWYEGTGTGGVFGKEASVTSRNTDYGGYGSTSFSQIGLATYRGNIPRW